MQRRLEQQIKLTNKTAIDYWRTPAFPGMDIERGVHTQEKLCVCVRALKLIGWSVPIDVLTIVFISIVSYISCMHKLELALEVARLFKLLWTSSHICKTATDLVPPYRLK